MPSTQIPSAPDPKAHSSSPNPASTPNSPLHIHISPLLHSPHSSNKREPPGFGQSSLLRCIQRHSSPHEGPIRRPLTPPDLSFLRQLVPSANTTPTKTPLTASGTIRKSSAHRLDFFYELHPSTFLPPLLHRSPVPFINTLRAHRRRALDASSTCSGRACNG